MTPRVRARLTALGVVALAVGLASSPVARADDSAAASAAQLIDQGIALRQSQHDAEALALFEQAQALSPSPRGEAQVALAEQALGRWVPSEIHLVEAMSAKGDAWIDARRPILARALDVIRDHLGDLELTGSTSGVVYVDGVRAGDRSTLSRLRLEAGRRALEVRTPGHYPFSRFIDVTPRETVRVEVEEKPFLPDVSPPPPPTASRSAPAEPVPAAREPDPSHAQRNVGLIFAGGAGVFLVTGAVGLLERESLANAFNGDPTCTGTPTNALSPTCRGRLNDGSTWLTVGVVGLVGGGLLGALSAVLLVTAPSSRPKSAWTLPCVPAARGFACGLHGTF